LTNKLKRLNARKHLKKCTTHSKISRTLFFRKIEKQHCTATRFHGCTNNLTAELKQTMGKKFVRCSKRAKLTSSQQYWFKEVPYASGSTTTSSTADNDAEDAVTI